MERTEAIKIIKTATVYTPEEMEALETLIPELRESEDEKMMRVIGLALTDVPEERFTSLGTTLKDCLTWIEQQNHDGKKWITPAELNRLETLRYEAGFDAGVRSEKEKQKEQKPAEVDESTKRLNDNWMKQHFDDYEEQQPAEWSGEDEKVIDTIVSVLGQYVDYKAVSGTGSEYATPRYSKEIDWLKSLLPQNKIHYWTEEEIEPIIDDYLTGKEHYGGMVARLRCLKPKSHWKPSEEQKPKQEVPADTEALTAKLVNLLKSYRIGEETATGLANRIADTYGTQRYLDGLCDGEKSKWKPSEEQIEALERCAEYLEESDNEDADILAGLYEHLKKLM